MSDKNQGKIQIWVKEETLLYEKELKKLQVELLKLQNHVKNKGLKILMIFEGRDAAGKGGAIKRVIEYQNKTHTRIVTFPKPSTKETGQWYFQKYVEKLPTTGEIVLFDRSWYNRAMVEKVFGWCDEQQYKDFMDECPVHEKNLVRDGNTILLKFYFSVSKEEQLKRFDKRKTNPLKQWKLSEVDLQAQDLWDEFTKVKYKMLKKTHKTTIPWQVIRSDNKHDSRIAAIKLILNSVDYDDRNKDLDYKIDDTIVVSGSREIEIMEADGVNNGIFAH